MHTRLNQLARFGSAVIITGTCFGFVGCGDVGRFVANINPCGTILNCDPVQYRFVTSGYDGPGADPDIDPACTYPPFCPEDPFVGGYAGGQ